jgi:pimeloyl-ACP methyl ester carboxylesterase
MSQAANYLQIVMSVDANLKRSWTSRGIRLWVWVGGCISLMLAAIIAYAKVDAARGWDPLIREELVSSNTNASELLVIVHGYTGNIRSMDDVQGAAHGAQPNADLLLLEYPAQPFSNTDCFRASEQICQKIKEHDKKQYTRIWLVGYSIGALLLRKAYVYGYGHIEDISPEAELPSESRRSMDWVQKVDRIVLLAGMNRGWTAGEKPRAMRWNRAMYYRIGTFIGKLSGTARLIRQCERGEPFVANLRSQWLDIMHSLPSENQPVVIQLLGSIDDIVSDEDNRDVMVCKDFIFVPVQGTGHAQAIRFKDSPYASERRQKCMAALGDDETVEQLRRESRQLPDDSNTQVETLVLVLHGIRDMGEWTPQYDTPLREAFRQKYGDAEKLQVEHPSYGYFAMGPFLLWSDRQVNVRWFMDQFTELKAKYPNLKTIDLIAHSYGTYVVANALRKYKAMRIDRAVFAGSVVRRDFDWSIVKGRIQEVRNYVGSNDWVVGLFPRLFENAPFNAFNRDIGSAGFNGFESSFGNAHETRFINGSHSAALQHANIQSIVDFIINGAVTTDSNIMVRNHPTFLDYASRLCLIVWLVILLFLVLLGWGWIRLIVYLLPKRMYFPVRLAIAYIAYLGVVIYFLERS